MTAPPVRLFSFASSIRHSCIARPLRPLRPNFYLLPHQYHHGYHQLRQPRQLLRNSRPGSLIPFPSLSSRFLSLPADVKSPFRRYPNIPLSTSSHQQIRNFAMAGADSVSQPSTQLEVLDTLEKYPNCYPEINPQDIYRSHITSILHKITGVDTSIIYNALQWTLSLDKGDMVLAIPALRVKGKPADLGAQWMEKVYLARHLLYAGEFSLTGLSSLSGLSLNL